MFEGRRVHGEEKPRMDTDQIVGLKKVNDFFESASKYVKACDVQCCMVAIDIEHFKLFRSWYGRDKGDELLGQIGHVLKNVERDYDCVSGYMEADDFAICMRYNLDHIHIIYDEIKSLVSEIGNQIAFLPLIGIYQIDADTDSVRDAYDFAMLAIDEAEVGLKSRIFHYVKETKKQAEEEYKLIMEFHRALEAGEITFFLQPQIRASSGKIVGAEALARWIKPDGSMVMPLEFIPLLERTGFILNLDRFIWESVCKWLVSCDKRGLKKVPVSVNVSQVDAFNMDVPKFFHQLVSQYGIDPKYVKIEITESTYAMDEEKIGEIVNRFRSYGFMVLMDDFGSGYSSLNMLRNVDIDVIKLDSNFINGTNSKAKRGLEIFESVVNMTRSLGLPIIVEGVETEEQVHYLKDMGCRYVQGFIVRPMPISKFEEYLKDENKLDLKGIRFKSNQQIKVREFLDENVYSDNMLNNILGAVAYYSRHGDHVDIIRYNEQFYQTIGQESLTDERNKDLQNLIPEEERKRFLTMLDMAYADKMNGAKDSFRFEMASHELRLYNIKVYFLEENSEEQKFYASVVDVTNVTRLQTKMEFLSNYVRSTILFIEKREDGWKYDIVLHGMEHVLGMSADDLIKELESGEFFRRVTQIETEMQESLEKMQEGAFLSAEGDVMLIIDGGKDISIHLTVEFAYGKNDDIMYVCEMYQNR